jgi:hypothetical protein
MQRLKTVGICMVVLSLVGLALAALNFKAGPTFFANGDGSYTATGELSGLGNTPAVATITIAGSATYTCQNPGGNTAPGQNQVTLIISGKQDLGNSDHNGRGTYDLTVGPLVFATTVSGKVAGCPNGNWTGSNPTRQVQRAPSSPSRRERQCCCNRKRAPSFQEPARDSSSQSFRTAANLRLGSRVARAQARLRTA